METTQAAAVAMLDAAVSASPADARLPLPDDEQLEMTSRGVYCNRLDECCDSNCWPSIIVTFFLVIFFVVMMLVCLCKFCMRTYNRWCAPGRTYEERRGLLRSTRSAPPQSLLRRDLPPPYHTVVNVNAPHFPPPAYLPSYDELCKTRPLMI